MSKFSVDAVFKGVDRVSQTMRSISSRMKALGDDKAFKKLNEQADGFIGGLRTIALTAVAAGTALAGIGANVIATGMEFEATLMGAVARFPGEIRRGTEAFNQLQGAAEQLGATTEFDAQQAAGALQTYAAAGFNAELAISSLAGAGNLATVSGLALDDAARTAADSLGALGLRSENAQQQAINLTRLNDRLARATGLANTSVEQLAEGIKVGGNMTIQSGQSFETFTALMASMAGANIKGAEAGTAIRNMFSSLQAPSSRAAKALQKLHINVADGEGNMRDMVDIVGDLSRATAELGEVERNAALNHIFGDAAMPAALALMNTGADGLRRFRTELNNSDGAAERMAATMRDTTKNEIDGFTSAIDGVKTALFGVVSGPFRQFLGQMTQWIGANTQVMASGVREWMQGLADNIETIKNRAQGLAVLVTGLGAIALGIKAVAAATAIWNALAAANPWMLAIMGIVVAVAALVAYRAEIEAFFKRFTIVRRIVETIGKLAIGLGVLVLGFKAAAVAAGIMNAALAFGPLGLVALAIAAIIAGIVLLDAYWPEISAYFEQLWLDLTNIASDIGEWFDGVWNAIAAHFEQLGQDVSNIASDIRAWFAETWGSIVASAINAWQSVLAGVQVAYDSIVGIFTPIVAVFSSIWTGIASAFNAIVGPIVDTASSVIDAIRQVVGLEPAGEGESGPRLQRAQPQVVTPQDRISRSVSETRSTTTAEVRVRAEPGTQATVARRPAQGSGVRVQRSGN